MSSSHTGPDSDLAPNPAVMVEFCRWWFERCNRGVIEIGWINAATGKLTEFEQFERGDLQAMAVSATQANLVPGQACYVRASTVHARGTSSGYTTDMDFEQAPGIWSDIDKPEDFERARTIETQIRPNGSVITGTIPHTRVQSWFRCSEPIVAPDMLRSLNVRLHKLYGGDSSVVNPSRLMRLPGTIAWPRKEGRVTELVQFVRPSPEDKRPSGYPISMLTALLPQITESEQQRAQPPSDQPHINGTSANPFGLGGLSTVSSLINAIKAGREWHNHMIQLVAHWVGAGRSSVEIMGHCADWTLPGFTLQQTRAEVAKAIEGARQKWHVPDADPVLSGEPVKQTALLSLPELLALPPPVWLVHGLVPEKSLIVPYGPPKSGKTFVVLSLGLHITAGMDWFGHPVQQGAVIYIAGEGTGGLSNRVRAMMTKYQIPDSVPFWTVRRTVNFTVVAEVNALEIAIRQAIGNVPLRLLVVDTLARAMPGADENSAQEVGAVIAAADYLKDALACTVALVHHSGKDAARGARGTSALRGAWDAAFEITASGKQTVMTVVDQKEAESGQRLVFRMEEVPVGIGRTSLVPVLDDGPGEESNHPTREVGGQTGIALQVLRDAIAGPEAAIIPWFSGKPDGVETGIHVETWRRKYYEKMPTILPEARKKSFQRAVEGLTRRRLIGVRDPWVWLG